MPCSELWGWQCGDVISLKELLEPSDGRSLCARSSRIANGASVFFCPAPRTTRNINLGSPPSDKRCKNWAGPRAARWHFRRDHQVFIEVALAVRHRAKFVIHVQGQGGRRKARDCRPCARYPPAHSAHPIRVRRGNPVGIDSRRDRRVRS